MTFKPYTKIKVLGDVENFGIFDNPEDEIVIEEKVDGANFRFMIKDGKVIFGSRTQELNEDKEHKFQKNFNACITLILDAFDKLDADTKKHSEGKIFYGENMVKHSISYDWEHTPRFLGFDIYDIQSGKFLRQKNKTNLFAAWNLSVVPLINICMVKDIGTINDDLVPVSKYISPSAADTKAEGVVFKNYEKQIFAKYVREKFKEKNREVFGGNKKYAKTDDEYFSLLYCTNARIDKCVFKLLDQGKVLGMELMGDLLNSVYTDIWEENWREIAYSKKSVDTLQLKKLISKRCLEVLKQTLINNAIAKNRLREVTE
jgi:hypothetical protein